MRGVKTNLFITAFVAVPLALGAWAVQKQIASNARAEVGRSLATVRDTTHLAVQNWFKDQKAAAVAWADDPKIRESALKLLALPSNQSTLLDSSAQQALRDWFRRIQTATRYRGYFIVGPNYKNLASSRDQNVGVKNLLVGQADFLSDIWAGTAAVSLPIQSDVPLADNQGQRVSGLPSMFVAAPIRNDTGEVIAIFMFRLDPQEGFTNILNQGRIGNTGETYAFDGDGNLISQSRFDDQLHESGILPAGERSILNIQLRDPGVNLMEGEKTTVPRSQQPLSFMAKSAIQGEAGIDLNGHRDYRGVPVVSAWVWDTDLGLGVATEVNVQEAYQTIHATQRTIISLTVFTFFLLIGLMVIYSLFRQRKFAETQARTERDKAQLYFDTVETMIVALNEQGNISRINRKGRDLLGYAEDELIGRNWFATCVPEQQREEVREVFNALVGGKRDGVDYYENEIVTRFGERRLIAWRNTFLTDENGNILGTLGSGEDITDRRRAEEALRESEKYNRMLFEESTIGLALCKLNGELVDVNPAFAAVIGRTVEETLKLSYWDITPEKYAAEEKTQLESLEKKSRYGPYEKEYIHANGHLVPVRLSGQILEKDGEKFIWSSVEDITEYKQADAELRRAATVFDNTDEGIMVTDAAANIILVNNAFTAITGFKSKDVLGKNPRFQKSGRHDPDFYQAMWDTLNRDGQWRGEIWNRRNTGEIYPAWENINVVTDEKGRVTNYVAIFSDISALKQSEERLAHLAHHDTLTELPNRLRFIANLEQAIESAKRHKHKVALMFLDLDRFKHINDTLGHNVGDQLLKTTAERLKSCVRAEDTVARLGGDEFTVVLTEIAQTEDAGLIAGKLVKAVGKPVKVAGETIHTSASVGISVFPDDATDCEKLLTAADTAMYHAKARGRNNFQFFTMELVSRTFGRAKIERELRQALKREQFELHYQPQIGLADGKVAGVEALVRWNHPEHGQLLPETFIHVADDSNLVDAISEWVLRTALSDYENWSKDGSMGPRIAVNITGRQITTEQSLKRILNILDELAPEPNTLQLDLEITETALERTGRTTNIIDMLKKRGVMFAIDDFGTGHSSLSRLKQLPIDTLKIDQSFVRDIADEGDDKAIAAAIIAMAHSLGLRVIGEGVETQPQLEILRALDCDEIQGFYFSKPVPAGEITQLLEKSFQ